MKVGYGPVEHRALNVGIAVNHFINAKASSNGSCNPGRRAVCLCPTTLLRTNQDRQNLRMVSTVLCLAAIARPCLAFHGLENDVLLSVRTHLAYTTERVCDVLLQIEANTDAAQVVHASQFAVEHGATLQDVEGEEGIGMRKWLRAGPRLECTYETRVEITRPFVELVGLAETPRHQIPGSAIQYLMPSRYCQSELFLDFTSRQFEGLSGGALVQSMSTWINANFAYNNGASHAGTTATDSFASMSGVCRDYAHVLIAFVRAVGIPARFVSAYAPDVTPQDFHAVVEVYLAGGWHLVDPTGMAHPCDIVRICVGRDAADASFLTSYGFVNLQEQSVDVKRL
jgi:hypothetical protein